MQKEMDKKMEIRLNNSTRNSGYTLYIHTFPKPLKYHFYLTITQWIFFQTDWRIDYSLFAPYISKKLVPCCILVASILRSPARLRCSGRRDCHIENRSKGWAQLIQLIITSVRFSEHWRSASSELRVCTNIAYERCYRSFWWWVIGHGSCCMWETRHKFVIEFRWVLLW